MNNPSNDFRLAYRAKMKDPRWRVFRARLISDRNCRCQECGEVFEEGLTIHHVDYLRGREPWEYPDDLVLVLCWDCHQGRQVNDEEALFEFARLLAQLKSQSVYEMARGIRNHVNGGAGGRKLYDAYETIRGIK